MLHFVFEDIQFDPLVFAVCLCLSAPLSWSVSLRCRCTGHKPLISQDGICSVEDSQNLPEANQAGVRLPGVGVNWSPFPPSGVFLDGLNVSGQGQP